MPTLTIREIPERVYERLRLRAARHRRSMSGEVVTLLEETLLPQPIDADAIIAEAEAVHARFPEPLPDLIAEGKRAGRRHENGFPAHPRSDEDAARDVPERPGR